MSRPDPNPGDVVQRSQGVEWRVLSVNGDSVVFQVVSTGEEHPLSLAQWRRLDLPTITVRDVAQELAAIGVHRRALANVEATLAGFAQLQDGAGWVRPVRRKDLLDACGIALASVQRSIETLAGHGLLVVDARKASLAECSHYQLIGEGRALAAAALLRVGAGRVRVGSGSGSGSPSTEPPNLGSCNEQAKQENQRVPDSRVGSGRVDSDAVGQLVVAVATLTGTVERLLARLALPPVPAALPPCERCGAPTVLREGPHGPFAGCSRFNQGCKPGAKRSKARNSDDERDPERMAIELARNQPPVSLANLAEVRAKLAKPAPVGDLVSQVIGATPGRGRATLERA